MLVSVAAMESGLEPMSEADLEQLKVPNSALNLEHPLEVDSVLGLEKASVVVTENHSALKLEADLG